LEGETPPNSNALFAVVFENEASIPLISALGIEENETIFIWNINNMMLRAIPREHNFDFNHRTGEMWRPNVKCSGRPGASKSCCMNNFSFEQLGV
jgi:hypothetical protein